MGNYKDLAKEIIDNVGGKENVNSVVHCITRLRFRLKDEDQAKTDILKDMDGVVTVMQAGGQYQVVIGNHVPAVYEDVVDQLGINPEVTEEVQEEKMTIFNRLIDIISGSFQPFLGVLAAGGMIKGLLALLVAFNWLAATSGTYLLLNAVGDAIFTFLPLVVGITAARKFHLNEFIGLALGATLMYPAIQLSVFQGVAKPVGTLFKGTIIESHYFTTFLGIPVIAQNYGGSVVPIIFAVWFASILYRFFKKIIPELLQTFFVPFFTLLISAPLVLLVIGPVLNILTSLLSSGFQAVFNWNPIIFMALVGLVWQVLVIFGLHWALVSIAIVQVSSGGVTQMLAGMFGTTFAQIAVVFALWLKFRKQDKGIRSIAVPAIISGIAGVTEPAIYGITLKRKLAFLYSMVGGAVGGAIMGMVNAKMYTMGGLGVFMLPNFVSPRGNLSFMYTALLAMVISAAVAFLLTFFFYGEKTETAVETSGVGQGQVQVTVSSDQAVAILKSESIDSPVQGQVRPLDQASDPVFGSGAMGKGVIIQPDHGEVFAPFDGEVVTIFPTGHAVGLRSTSGAELLIHVGMDTVALEGKYYEKFVETGQLVKKGDLLIKFDIAAIESAGYKVETPVIVTNTQSYTDILTYTDGGRTIIETVA